MSLRIGNRAARGSIRWQRTHSFDSVPSFADGDVTEVALRSFKDGMARRTTVMLTPIALLSGPIVHLGVLTGTRREDPTRLQSALARAAEQYHDAMLDRP